MTKISATIVAHSRNEFGNELISYLLTYPRFIHSEIMTHRMFSRNAASSRAVPAKKLIQAVKDDPFIPIAWQKDHSGMQGTEYFTEKEIQEKRIIDRYLYGRDMAVQLATELNTEGVTKQLSNRVLEPFQWYTCLVTATEFENFFALRCPQYDMGYMGVHRSWKDVSTAEKIAYKGAKHTVYDDSTPLLKRLSYNKGQAEIHLMALAEAMWDAKNESVPTELKAGEWHLPFGDEIRGMFNLDITDTDTDGIPYLVKISAMMAARTSYTVVGTDLSDWTLEKYMEKVNSMATATPLHASPFEHPAKAMSNEEYKLSINGKLEWTGGQYDKPLPTEGSEGWCVNLRGFIQYRKMIPNENITT